GLVDVVKGFERNRPQTLCKITDDGRKRFLDYLAVLDQVVRDAAAAAKAQPGEDPLPGWAPA
ncbi:MAG TPA: transcriptional regulator, partial [Caulobacteraceae bacterium]|nr:transcriptional regulator [Caulobacteraceae bacterium]